MEISEGEKTIYYAGYLYYEMAGALLKQFKEALKLSKDELRGKLKDIKLDSMSMYDERVLNSMTQDEYNDKKNQVIALAPTDGLKLYLPKRMKKSPPKKRRSGSRRR